MIKHSRNNKHQYFFGILKKFQGVGFIISTDNAITVNEFLLIEVRFIWLRFWYTYELTKK